MNNKGRGDLFAFCRKFDVLITHGSVATCLRWGG